MAKAAVAVQEFWVNDLCDVFLELVRFLPRAVLASPRNLNVHLVGISGCEVFACCT